MTDSRNPVNRLAAISLRHARFNHSIRMAAANGDYERIRSAIDDRIQDIATEGDDGEGGSGDSNAGGGADVDQE